MIRHLDKKRSYLALALMSLATAYADTESTPSTPAEPSSGKDRVVLDSLVVTNTKSTTTVLPVRDVTAVYGFATPLQDIPRSITQINPQQFEKDIIASTSDFTRYSPAVNQATGNLGNFGSPTMRGALGESYQNDIRLLNRQSNNRPFTLNAYEAADLVAGPAPVIFGPSARTAGYANFITKKPYFDHERSAVTFKLGKWFPGDAGYKQNLNWQVDTGAPIIQGKLAYRLSYQGENVNSYYRNAGDSWHDLYGTLGWVPHTGLTIDWNFEAGRFDYQNYGGLNRVTQNLINNGTYLAGPSTPILKGSFSSTGYYSPVYVPGVGFDGQHFIARTKSGTRYLAGAALTGAPTQAQAGTITGYVFDPSLVHEQQLDGQSGYTSPLTDSWTKAFNTQLRVKLSHSEDLAWVNNTVYQYYQTNNYSGTQSENYIESTVFENRTEARVSKEFELFGKKIRHDSDTGISLRYDYVLNYKDTDASNTSSAGDYYDITDPSTYGRNAFFGATVAPLYTNTVKTRYGWLTGFNLALPVPEVPDYFSTPGGSGKTGTGTTATGLSAATNETSVYGLGLFSQHSFKLEDKWILDLGARATLVAASLKNPLPANDTNAAIHDNTSHLLPSTSASLSYKVNPRITSYVTYSYVQAQNGMTSGSPTWSSGNSLSAKNFHSQSDLEETGVKVALIPDRLFGTVSVYRQTRDLTYQATTDGTSVLAKGLYRGVETSLRYQASKNLSVGVNYSYLAANYIDNNVSVAAPLVVDNASLIGASTSLGIGSWRIANLPRNNATFFSSYTFNNGFGVKADFWVRDSYNVGGDSSIRVPGEHNLNVGLFYDRQRWYVGVDAQNVTNERLFAGASTLLEPFSLQGRFTFRF